MNKLLVVGLGGFIGAVARYGLSGFVHRYSNGSFPTGTLVVNLLGCLVIGILMSLVEQRQYFSPSTRLFLMIGLLGSFTTFSTVAYETVEFLKDEEFLMGFWNATANMLLGIVAVGIGWISVKAFGV